MSKLNKCTCGRTGHLCQWSEHDMDWYVPCKCGLTISHITKEAAIKAWNTRSTSEVRKVLEGLLPLKNDYNQDTIFTFKIKDKLKELNRKDCK